MESLSLSQATAAASVEEDACAEPGEASFAESSSIKSCLAAPLYITIGPPCSGKTTWARRQCPDEASSTNNAVEGMDTTVMLDVALDDQPGVYMALETNYFLLENNSAAADADANTIPPFLIQRRMFGKTLWERIQADDQAELRCILQRLAGNITAQQCQETIEKLYFQTNKKDDNNNNNKNNSNPAHQETVVPVLLKIVEKLARRVKRSKLKLPATTDLFLREAIYLKNYRTNLTGVESAYEQLHNCSIHRPLVWGNTNTRPSDYKGALELAEQQQRPVYFVIYREKPTTTKTPPAQVQINNDQEDEETGEIFPAVEVAAEENDHDELASVFTRHDLENNVIFELTSNGYADLMRRNLNRLLETGRYVPASVIWDMQLRTVESIERAIHNWKRDQQQQQQQQPAKTNNDDNEEDACDGNQDKVTPQMTKWDLDRYLARAVHFEMNQNRTVVSGYNLPPLRKKRPPQQYQQPYGDGPKQPYQQRGMQRPWDRPRGGGGGGRGGREDWGGRNRGGGRGASGPPSSPQRTLQSYWGTNDGARGGGRASGRFQNGNGRGTSTYQDRNDSWGRGGGGNGPRNGGRGERDGRGGRGGRFHSLTPRPGEESPPKMRRQEGSGRP